MQEQSPSERSRAAALWFLDPSRPRFSHPPDNYMVFLKVSSPPPTQVRGVAKHAMVERLQCLCIPRCPSSRGSAAWPRIQPCFVEKRASARRNPPILQMTCKTGVRSVYVFWWVCIMYVCKLNHRLGADSCRRFYGRCYGGVIRSWSRWLSSEKVDVTHLP